MSPDKLSTNERPELLHNSIIQVHSINHNFSKKWSMKVSTLISWSWAERGSAVTHHNYYCQAIVKVKSKFWGSKRTLQTWTLPTRLSWQDLYPKLNLSNIFGGLRNEKQRLWSPQICCLTVSTLVWLLPTDTTILQFFPAEIDIFSELYEYWNVLQTLYSFPARLLWASWI